MRGRIRSIKPEVFLDEDLWFLEQETGLPVFRAFTGLWTQSDREGRFEWRPLALKAAVLPYWQGDFSRVLDALATRGFIVRYASGTREYGIVRTFKRHQAINGREPASSLPAPPKEYLAIPDTPGRVEDASSTRRPRDTCTPAGTEGNGTEGRGNDASATRAGPPRPPSAPPTSDSEASSPEASALLDAVAQSWEDISGQALRALDFEPVLSELLDRAEREDVEPAEMFARAARAFCADCAKRSQRPVLRWLIAQFGEWSAAPLEREDDDEKRLRLQRERQRVEQAKLEAELKREQEFVPPPPEFLSALKRIGNGGAP